MFAMILPVLLAAAPLPPADTALPAADAAALDAKVAEIYRPYSQGSDDTAAWDRPVFSAEVTALIAHWQRVLPAEEPDRLNDGDWFCQCQDWDAATFKVMPGAQRALADGAAEVAIAFDLGLGEGSAQRGARLIFKREQSAWKLDDIFAEGFATGLKQALRETIAEDEALAAKN